MSGDYKTNNPELEVLFDRYRRAPESHVFAPLADACRKAGMLEEAIQICEKGVSAHPTYASGLVVRGKCYYDIGNMDQAEASFERVLDLDGNNLVALKYMGFILADRGHAAGARARFEHILSIDPDDREISTKLAELPSEPGEQPLDKTLAEELAHVLDGGPDGDEEPGTIELQEVKDQSFAGKEIRLGSNQPTADVLATMTLADIYASQGYRRKAVKIYRGLLDSHPDDETIRGKLEALGTSTAFDERREPGPAAARLEPEPVEPPEPDAPEHELADAPGSARPEAREHEAATDPAPPVTPPVEETAGAVKASNDDAEEDERADRSSRKDTGEMVGARETDGDPPPTDPRDLQQFRRWLDSLNS